jgi:hypothetical protein
LRTGSAFFISGLWVNEAIKRENGTNGNNGTHGKRPSGKRPGNLAILDVRDADLFEERVVPEIKQQAELEAGGFQVVHHLSLMLICEL